MKKHLLSIVMLSAIGSLYAADLPTTPSNVINANINVAHFGEELSHICKYDADQGKYIIEMLRDLEGRVRVAIYSLPQDDSRQMELQNIIVTISCIIRYVEEGQKRQEEAKQLNEEQRDRDLEEYKKRQESDDRRLEFLAYEQQRQLAAREAKMAQREMTPSEKIQRSIKQQQAKEEHIEF